ncbi:MAG TPA: hypothetical protein VGE23_01515 [Candidatus Paceibacterota bacterium]
MNRLVIPLFVLALLAIGGGAAWYLIDSHNDSLARLEQVASTTPDLSQGLAIYSNGTYGFTLFYPENAMVSYSFDPSYHLGTSWRANALPDAQGTPLVAIIPYATQSEHSYPRYYNAMVRIGVSADPREIERCLEPARDQGETALPDRDINGVTWKAFAFESAGMMQYARGISYRTMREEGCIALEQVRTGSSYREAEPAPRDIPDETLDAAYARLEDIVESISFVR